MLICPSNVSIPRFPPLMICPPRSASSSFKRAPATTSFSTAHGTCPGNLHPWKEKVSRSHADWNAENYPPRQRLPSGRRSIHPLFPEVSAEAAPMTEVSACLAFSSSVGWLGCSPSVRHSSRTSTVTLEDLDFTPFLSLSSAFIPRRPSGLSWAAALPPRHWLTTDNRGASRSSFGR